jgi:hypothetical protein
MKNSSDTIGNRTCDLLVCSAERIPVHHQINDILEHVTERKVEETGRLLGSKQLLDYRKGKIEVFIISNLRYPLQQLFDFVP